jgi:hypothetical protein
MALTPIIELGVAEAYRILTERFGVTDLPPLEAIDNEDWGRDYLLGRFLERSASELAHAGLIVAVEEERESGCPERPTSPVTCEGRTQAARQ